MITKDLPRKTIVEFYDSVFPQDLATPGLKPFYKDCKNAICLASSDEYAPFASVVIASICANASEDEFYDIVLLSKDMTLVNRKILLEIVKDNANVSLRFVIVSEFIKNLNLYVWGPFTVDTYIRLLIPQIFKNFSKVLYLDSDVVVNEDVSHLIKINLDGYFMAATFDTHVISYCNSRIDYPKYNTEKLGLKNPEEYYQMGVALYNIFLINKSFSSGYLIDQAKDSNLTWLDQDLLNKLFIGKIKKIENKWNVMVFNSYPYADEFYLPNSYKDEYVKARENPHIIHYIGKSMPCFVLHPDLFTIFWKYARLSPYYEILLQKMSLNAAHRYNLQKDLDSIQNSDFFKRANKYSKLSRKIFKYKVLSFITFGFISKFKDRKHYYKNLRKSV